MRGSIALLIACGCNPAFGLDQAQTYDALPIDAPPACPATGVPEFSQLLHQAFSQYCTDYTLAPDATLAVALCSHAGDKPLLSEGPPDLPLAATQLVPKNANVSLMAPRTSPDGAELVAVQLDSTMGTTALTFGRYERGASGWAWKEDLPVAPTREIESSTTPSRRIGGRRRLLYVRVLGPNTMHELGDDGAGWYETAVYAPGELGVDYLAGPMALSADGLKLVYIDDDDQLRYSVRGSFDERFSEGKPLTTFPTTVSPNRTYYFTDDCGRLYFEGLSSIFYAQQR